MSCRGEVQTGAVFAMSVVAVAVVMVVRRMASPQRLDVGSVSAANESAVSNVQQFRCGCAASATFAPAKPAATFRATAKGLLPAPPQWTGDPWAPWGPEKFTSCTAGSPEWAGLPETARRVALALTGHLVLFAGCSTVAAHWAYLSSTLLSAGMQATRRTLPCVMRSDTKDTRPDLRPRDCKHVCVDWKWPNAGAAAAGLTTTTCYLQLQPMRYFDDMPWSAFHEALLLRTLRESYSARAPSVVLLIPSVHYIKRSVVQDRGDAGRWNGEVMWSPSRGFSADAASYLPRMRDALPNCTLLVFREASPTGFRAAGGLYPGPPLPPGYNSTAGCTAAPASEEKAFDLNRHFHNSLSQLCARLHPFAVLSTWEATKTALERTQEDWLGYALSLHPGHVDCVHTRCGVAEAAGTALLAAAVAERGDAGCVRRKLRNVGFAFPPRPKPHLPKGTRLTTVGRPRRRPPKPKKPRG